MTDPLRKLCEKLDYEFRDVSLLQRAVTHRSAGSLHYERLEYLGDAVLGVVIADLLFHNYPHEDEGILSRLRANLVNKDTLAGLARDLAIGDCLRLGSGELKSGGQSRDSILADSLEAIFGAIFLDSGFGEAQRVVANLYETLVASLPPDLTRKDPKTRLQEYLQGRGVALPAYQVLSVSGAPHAQQFEVACHADGLEGDARGRGTSRRRAEQEAARIALELLQQTD